jgi:hypothetical protein
LFLAGIWPQQKRKLIYTAKTLFYKAYTIQKIAVFKKRKKRKSRA